MPSHTFDLARPESTSEYLPNYNAPSSTPPSYLAPASHSKKLSTILEMEDDVEETELSGPVAASFWSSIEMKKLLSVEYATMVPQALLVDASSTLCAYLYFTSLQARMALEHKASLDILSTICVSMPDDADASLLHACAAAISQYQSTASLALIGSSHHQAIALVIAKAIFGFLILKYASRYVRPFDFLVASGAAHCLMLYCLFFVPVANLLEGTAITGASVWIRVMTKFFWLLIVSAVFAMIHWSVKTAFASAKPQPIALSKSAAEDSFKGSDEKDATEIV